MSSFRSHQQNLLRMLNMLEKGRFISRGQAARLFDCSEDTITNWISELKEDGHDIRYSRSLQKYILHKKNEQKK
ncbi:MAG: helix-turn-helix domain-containing protein [Daejeonella sp.]